MSKQPIHDGPIDQEKKKELSIAVTAAEDFEEKVEEVGKVTPPDGGYGWVVVAASFLVNMAVDGIIYTVANILKKPWALRFGSEATASLTFSLLTGCYYISGPIVAAFVNVFGIRPVAIAGSIISTTAFLLCSRTEGQIATYLSFGVLAGLGFGAMYLPSIVVLSTYFAKRRSVATGIAVCGSGIGTVVFSQLNEIVYAYFNQSVPMFILYLAAIASTGAIFSLFFAPLKASDQQVKKVAKMVRAYEGKTEEPTERLLENVRNDLDELNRPGHQSDAFYVGNPPVEALEKAEAAHVVHATEQHTVVHVVKKSKFTQFKESLYSVLDKDLLFSPSFMTLAVSGIFTVMSFLVPFVYIKDVMPETIDDTRKATIITLIGIFNIAFRILCGAASDHPKMSALQVSNFATILGGIAVACVPFCTEYWHYVVFTIPFSAGVACFAALRSVICVELIGVEKLSNAFGILMVFMGIGAVAGSPVAGMLKDLTGKFDLPFYVMGGVFSFSGIMTLRLFDIKAWEEKRKADRLGTEMRVLSQKS
ncbi:hypothetical protein L5515_006857 [Caenorhabditis briggsae]|uniref:Major facilitator superfamily (MFS) profile domain-containing protein n=1 Tax=Caenorhabditis briggsae TaxID=6238 RepID=A0AAE9JLE6_CAEBR|nr:hypothetical protein L5515_006857 [Caenorhabditis briggsae]